MPTSPIPSQNPLLVVKMNLFKARPSVYRNTGGHPGIDIWSPMGDDWVTCVDGFVHIFNKQPWEYTGSKSLGTSYSGYGAGMAIDWGQADGFIRMIYGHGNNRRKELENQHVAERRFMCESGNTGFSTGPHLHLEMRHFPNNKTGKFYDGLVKRRYNLLNPLTEFLQKYKIPYKLA